MGTLPPEPPPALSIRDLVIEFGPQRRPARVLHGVSIEVRRGEIVGLVGESGSGKTLTALAAIRLLPRGARIAGGTVALGTTSLLDLTEREMQAVRGARIALIPQDPAAALNPTMRIGRQVGEPLRLHAGASPREAASAAVGLLDSVRIRDAAGRARDYPHQYAGGMQQRALIAMALALRPELIIADEPTTALDARTGAEILALLRGVRDQRGTAILFISHDLGAVRSFCDRVYVVHRGTIVESGPVDAVLAAPQADATRALLAAVLPAGGVSG